MEPDLINEYIPGDEQYQQGIAPLVNESLFVPEGQVNIPIKTIASNVAKNLSKNYILKKAGIDGMARNVIGSIGTSGILGLNPIAMMTLGSSLPNPVKGIAGYLRNKRMQKEMARNQRMLDSRVLSQELANQITSQNIIDDRGRGQIPSRSAPAPAPRPERQTAGVGGLHSGYK